MWELIRINRRKSIILFIILGLCLLVLGYVIGMTADPRTGGMIGLSMACIIWLIGSCISYFGGDSIMLILSHAKEVTHDVHPQLFNIVEEMKIAANWPTMPRIYIIPEEVPNAFATGINPKRTAIAVTAGLLSRLNRDELQGVIAHEMSHIVNRDVLFMTFAGVLLGSIVMISEVFLRSMWYSGSSRRYRSRSSSSSGGQGQAVIMLIAILFAILSPLLAQILYYTISRKREYLADASAVRLTRYPEGLASALERISRTSGTLHVANKATAPLYIANPLRRKGKALSSLMSTHPPIEKRIQVLRHLTHGVNFIEYDKAFSQVVGKGKKVLPPSAQNDTEKLSIREADADSLQQQDEKKTVREIGDMMRMINKYAFLVCTCGLKMKVPDAYTKSSITCPRCGRVNQVPVAELVAVGQGIQAGMEYTGEKSTRREEPLRYTRKGHGWQTFTCSCGQHLQLSPAFQGTHMTCGNCTKKIEIAD